MGLVRTHFKHIMGLGYFLRIKAAYLFIKVQVFSPFFNFLLKCTAPFGRKTISKEVCSYLFSKKERRILNPYWLLGQIQTSSSWKNNNKKIKYEKLNSSNINSANVVNWHFIKILILKIDNIHFLKMDWLYFR